MSEIQIKCPKCSADLQIDKEEFEALQGTTISCLECNADIVLPRSVQGGGTPKFCSSCGTSITPNTKFCTKCGTKVNGLSIPRNEEPQPMRARLAVTPIQLQTSFPTNSIHAKTTNSTAASTMSWGRVVASFLICGYLSSQLGEGITIITGLGGLYYIFMIVGAIFGGVAAYKSSKNSGGGRPPHLNNSNLENMYSSYEEVPWFRRSFFVSLLTFTIWPIALGIILTGDVYYVNNGEVKTREMAAKVIMLILIAFLAVISILPILAYVIAQRHL